MRKRVGGAIAARPLHRPPRFAGRKANRAAASAVPRCDGSYADLVIVALQASGSTSITPYHRLLDVGGASIVAKLDLTPVDLSDFVIIHVWFQLEMPIWRGLLWLSADLYQTGEIQVVDVTGFDRIATGQYYGHRTTQHPGRRNSVLVDCPTELLLDVHCTKEQPDENWIGREVSTANPSTVTTVTAEDGHRWNGHH